MLNESIVPLMAAGGPSSFGLIQKNQKIKPTKSFHPQGHTPGPAFVGWPLPAFVLGIIKTSLFHKGFCLTFPAADKLRTKSGKTMVALCVAGHSEFLQKGWAVRARAGFKFSSPGFGGFAGQGPVRQRSLSADLNFYYFCFKTKVVAPRGHERHDAFSNNKILYHRIINQKQPVNKSLLIGGITEPFCFAKH